MRKRRPLAPYQVSEKSYLLSDISRSNSPLPLPCLVEDGYYGSSAWDSVSAGEVIFLNTLEKRPRALATDGHKHYSIPLDYPLKFSVISKDKGYSVSSTKTIEEIVNHYTPPVTVKVDQKNSTLHLVSDLRAVLHLGNLELTRTYEEKYFTGHSVIHNKLQNEMIMLPTFLKFRVRIIEGITGYSKAQWVDVLEGWKKVVKQPSLNSIKPPIDIVMFSSIPTEAESKAETTTIHKTSEDIYETLEPTTYVKLNFNLAQRKSYVYTSLPTATQTTTSEERTEDSARRSQSTVTAMARGVLSSFTKSIQGFQTTLQQTLSNRTPSESHRPVPPPKSPSEGHRSRRPLPPTPPGTNAEELSSVQLSPSTDQTPPPPTTQGRLLASESLPNQPDQISPRRHSRIHSLKEIPASVEELNSEEIADCLRLLKMARYIDSFLANQVDGALLSELNEELLINDLQMTPLHARKLILFAQKGWRPRQGPSDIHL